LLIGGFEPRIIDPVSGAVRLEIPRHASGWLVQAVAISPNGSLLATGTDHQGAVMLWDASTGARVTDLHGPVDSIGPMAFSPDGLMLAALAPFGGGVFVWDVTTGEQMARGVDRSAWDVCCPPAGLAFSPDGSRIAVTTFSGVVKVLDIASGEWVMTLSGHTSPVSGVEYLAGKNTLITGSMDGSIRMWDATTGTQISAVDAGIGQIISLDVSPDGQRLLVGGDGGGVGLWALETSTIRPLAALPGGHHSFVMQVAFDQSGRIGASSTLSGEVLIWDATPSGPGEVAAWTAGRPAAFSGEGRMIATTGPGGRDVVIRGTSDWQTRVVLEDVAPYVGQPDEEWGHVSGMSFSPDGDRLVTATGSRLETVDGSVTIWDIASGEPIRTLFHHPFMKGPPAWSGNGSRIAVAACDDFGAPGRVWDAETGELVFTTPGAACGQSVDLDHSGRFLAVQTLADSHNVRVWDVDTGELVSAMTHSPLWIGAVAFNPDGTRIVTGGGDGTARIWDVADGGLVRTLTGHTGALEDAIWSSDGSTVITGSHDGTIRLWNANTGETDLVLGDHGTFPFVAISPDGRYLASGVETGVQIWALNLDDLIEIARTRGGRPLSEAECIAYHFETCPTSP
jgi:WD40 repeat protein